MTINTELVYGSKQLEKIVAIEPVDDKLYLFIEEPDRVKVLKTNNSYFLMSNRQIDRHFTKTEGNLHYKWIKFYKSRRKFIADYSQFKKKNYDLYTIFNEHGSALALSGYRFFQGITPKEIGTLSFDIETTGLTFDSESYVILISNTFVKGDKVVKKLFSHDEYNDQCELIEDWCKWVREIDPSIILGHNILGYDIPYLNYIASNVGASLNLGRFNKPIKIEERESRFRVDQTQGISYNKVHIFGRQLIDTRFLAIKADIGKQLESYSLKSIVKQLGYEKEDRTFYDASKIRDNYTNPEEMKKIKAYAIDDADDSLSVYNHYITPFYYFNRSVPKTFEEMILSATGSQLNSILISYYLHRFHSIPVADPAVEYEGAISIGNAGVYKNVMKLDVSSLYPSIMRNYKVFNKDKDPLEAFLQMLETFTLERLKNKELAKETGDSYYKALEQTQKIGINSAYGLLGVAGLNFNSPQHAAEVTRRGREILTTAIDWAKEKSFHIVNGDTDSISFCKEDQSDVSKEEFKLLNEELNSKYPPLIRWEDDGLFKVFVVLKAKNYIMKTEEGKIKFKGSALKSAKLEPALKQLQKDIIDLLMDNKKEQCIEVYTRYVKSILNLTDIKDWCSKKSISETMIKSDRKNETQIIEAVKEYTEHFRPGDKFYIYYTKDDKVRVRELYQPGDHSVDRLFKRLYDCVQVFGQVIDTKSFPNYSLKRNKKLLESLNG